MPTLTTVHIEISNNDGVPFSAVTGSAHNIMTNFFLSSTDVRAHGSGTITEDIMVELKDDAWQKEGLQYNERRVVDVNVQFLIPQDVCHYAHFICINITAGNRASYLELDPSNNIACYNSSAHIICQPGAL